MPNIFPTLATDGSQGVSSSIPGFVGPQGPPGPPGTGTGVVGTPERLASATSIVFDFYTSTTKIVTLTSSVTTTSAIRASDGLEVTVIIYMGTGGHSFTFPPNFVNAVQINSANGNNVANGTAIQKWIYDASLTQFFPLTPLMT